MCDWINTRSILMHLWSVHLCDWINTRSILMHLWECSFVRLDQHSFYPDAFMGVFIYAIASTLVLSIVILDDYETNTINCHGHDYCARVLDIL